MARKLAAGNWKMHGASPNLAQVQRLVADHGAASCDVLLCPPATLVHRMAAICAGSKLSIGGQDCHGAETGAHTGDISAQMLADAGATYVIVGHSERRMDHAESNADVRAKAEAAIAAGLTAIVCLGESESQRRDGATLHVVGTQLIESLPKNATADNLIIAYEPIWAIGTGLVPTLAQIGEVHDFLREKLRTELGEMADDIPLLYGGSVKPSNAAEIFAVANVDGALVGGASLKADDFSPIITALQAHTE